MSEMRKHFWSESTRRHVNGVISLLAGNVRRTDAHVTERGGSMTLYNQDDEPESMRYCSRCGMSEEDNENNGYGPLCDVSVITAEGEEGFAHVTQLLCQDDLIYMIEALAVLGFKDHHHGGIDFLEDQNCLIYKNNPYPPPCQTEQEQYIVPPPIKAVE